MLDKPLRPPPRRRDKTAGQALTEATLMLSLLAFTWMAAGYMTFKTQNGIRTAMGARHGAWMRAHGTDPSGGQTEDDFFAHTGIASLNAQNSETVTLPGEFAALAASAAGPAYQVENVEVGFNVLAKVGSREHPYVGLTMQPPFMRDDLYNVILFSDFTGSQWPRITEFFTDRNRLSDYGSMVLP